ncbi:fimbrillin family protein [Alistipes sp.]|uniref:fimbrillin family protein n=1 Tax=Alistipes sp. TaxID=1872444 RepID=UPI003AEFF1CF
MKRTESLYRTAVLLLLLMLAAACTRDDTLDDAAPGNATGPAAPLTITVTDGAYAPEASAANAATDNGAPVTRAVENGYATGFTKGDQIGLYVATARPGNSSYPGKFDTMLHENLRLTYDGTRWTLPDGIELKYDPAEGRLYFAYYPYQANMDGNEPDGNDPNGLPTDTAPEFFHALIGRWKPRNDQSTYADYTASDLMVARGEVAIRTDGTPGSLLSFTMEHQMQLNIVRLPHTTSTYTEEISGNQQTKSYDLYTGVAHLPNFWMENPHTARYITNPSGDVKKITGCYYYDSRPVERKFDIEIPRQDDLRGKYKTYTIDGGAETTTERPLAEGDFYMKDGTVLPQEAIGGGNLPADVKKDCIGVVFWVGEKDETHWTQTGYREGDHLLMNEHPACTHGMVVALADASSGVAWATNPLDGKTLWEWADTFDGFTDNEKSLWKMIRESNSHYGYGYNALFGLYTAHNDGATFPAYGAVKTYASSHPTPEGCSGWFFPGMFELATIWFDAPDQILVKPILGKMNLQIKKAGGIELTGRYWSSNDWRVPEAWTTTSAPEYDFYYGFKSQTEKHNVRAVLAF